MRNLFKCHFAYLLNKPTIYILCLANCFIIMNFVSNIDNETRTIWSYYYSSLVIVKICFVFITIYIMSLSINRRNDYYAYYILTCNISRNKYIISKILLIIYIVFTNMILMFILFLLIGFLFQKNFYFNKVYFWGLLEVFFIVIIYGLYGMLLMQLFQNQLTVIIPIVLLIVTNDLRANDIFKAIILFMFPNNREYETIYLINLMWLFWTLFIINISFYHNKDLNY